MTTELPTPPDEEGSGRSQELARAWLVGGVLHCALQADVFEDPAAWGEVLADLARHVAHAVHEADGGDVLATLKAIRTTFVQELGDPAEGA
jgi:hypothetical protein